MCIDARLPPGIHGHSDHIPLVGSVVAPEIHRKSDTFKHVPHKEFINFGQRVIALKGRVDELLASYVGETFFLSPREISGATNKEVDKLHSTWIEIVIKTRYGRTGFVITGLAVGDLNYK